MAHKRRIFMMQAIDLPDPNGPTISCHGVSHRAKADAIGPGDWYMMSSDPVIG